MSNIERDAKEVEHYKYFKPNNEIDLIAKMSDMFRMSQGVNTLYDSDYGMIGWERRQGKFIVMFYKTEEDRLKLLDVATAMNNSLNKE